MAKVMYRAVETLLEGLWYLLSNRDLFLLKPFAANQDPIYE